MQVKRQIAARRQLTVKVAINPGQFVLASRASCRQTALPRMGVHLTHIAFCIPVKPRIWLNTAGMITAKFTMVK